MKINIFSDMTTALPQTAISDNYDRFNWRAIEYETNDFCGKMLAANGDSLAPAISLPLGLEGWYDIYLGLFTDDNEYSCGINVKLSKDRVSTFVKPDKASHHPMYFEEVYYRTADLTGNDIEFSHPNWGYPVSSYIVYVKCVKAERKEMDADTKRLIGMNDMHGIMYIKRPSDIEPFLEDIEPYRDTDFGKIYLEYWGNGEEYWEHKGMFGNGDLYDRTGDKNVYDSRRILRSKGNDVYPQVIAYAKQLGLEVYLSSRMNDFAAEAPFDTCFTSDFYRDFPQLRCRDKDGAEIARMSLAFPEVQEIFLNSFEKMASYGVDGISLLFNRGMPFMLYEEPLTDGFFSIYGEDPRKLDDTDPRWLEYRCSVMTDFISKLRMLLNRISQRLKIPMIKISVHCMANGKQNRFFALDPHNWAKQGIVDDIVAYPIAITAPNVKTLSAGKVVDIDVDYYVESVKNTRCRLFIDMLPREMEPEEYRKRALEYYHKGVYGLCFWDSNARHTKLRQWSIVRRLGHIQELEGDNMEEGIFYKTIEVKSIGGIRVDRFPPVWGL